MTLRVTLDAALRGAPAPFAGDDLVAIARGAGGGEFADDDGLNHAVGADRSRQVFEALVVHVAARLVVIGLEQVDVHVQRCAWGDQRGSRVWNQRAEAFAEGGSFLHN